MAASETRANDRLTFTMTSIAGVNGGDLLIGNAPVRELVSRVRAGDSPESVAEDFNLNPQTAGRAIERLVELCDQAETTRANTPSPDSTPDQSRVAEDVETLPGELRKFAHSAGLLTRAADALETAQAERDEAWEVAGRWKKRAKTWEAQNFGLREEICQWAELPREEATRLRESRAREVMESNRLADRAAQFELEAREKDETIARRREALEKIASRAQTVGVDRGYLLMEVATEARAALSPEQGDEG